MEKSEVASRVSKVIQSVLKINSDVPENANFIFDLGADSLQSIQLIAAFEEEFDIEMDDEKAMKVQTVSEAVDFIFPYIRN